MFSSDQIFKISGDKIEDLQATLELVDKMNGMKVAAYRFTKDEFRLYWHLQTGDYSKLPDKMTCVDLLPLITAFLKNSADYSKQKNFGDGTTKEGWCVMCEPSHMYQIIKIIPNFSYYSK